jgi:hypothetical protein
VIRSLPWVFALGVFGCDPHDGLHEQQTVAHLCWTEERLRRAANPDKAALLAELATAPCPDRAACTVRDKCAAAYTLHVDALKLTQAAKQRMQAGEGQQAAGLLSAAEANLKQAGVQVAQCTELTAKLRHDYAVDR